MSMGLVVWANAGRAIDSTFFLSFFPFFLSQKKVLSALLSLLLPFFLLFFGESIFQCLWSKRRERTVTSKNVINWKICFSSIEKGSVGGVRSFSYVHRWGGMGWRERTPSERYKHTKYLIQFLPNACVGAEFFLCGVFLFFFFFLARWKSHAREEKNLKHGDLARRTNVTSK